MKRVYLIAGVLALCGVIAGCSQPLLFNSGLYSHTVEPLTINPNPTEVRESLKKAKGSIMQISDPLTSALSIRLGKNGLADVAKKHGMETIYYADLESWNILFGLWSSDVVHIYGK